VKRDALHAMPRWLRVVSLLVIAFGLAFFVHYPVFKALPNTQGGDGAVFHKMLEAARVSVTRYHELPLWNPYECGGLPLWDNPQAPVGAPLVWLMFLVGTTKMMALWYVIHSAIGFLCMWVFARRDLELSRQAAFIAGTAWAFAGFHQQHYAGGHFAFVPFLYFPLGIYLWRRAADDARHAVGLGVLVAWMIYEGGVYPLPHLAVILFVETLVRIRRKNALKILRASAIVVVVGLTLGASRFLPVLDQLRSHTRNITAETDALQWKTLKDMFLSRTHERIVPGQEYVWPEYGSYLGPIILCLAIVGVLIAGVEYLWLTILLGFALMLMFGHGGKYAPWHVLKGHVFPFKEMRVPSRFRCEVSLFLAAFAGIAVDRIAARLSAMRVRYEIADAARTTLAAIALLGAGDIMSVGVNAYEGSFVNPPESDVQAAPNLHIASDTVNMIDQPRQNHARLMCWEEWGFGQGAPLWLGDVPQARSTNATLRNIRRTPNTFVFDVSANGPARVQLNSTWEKPWRTNVGTVAEENLQLVVDVPPGSHHVVVRYRPRTFTAGVVLTFTSLTAVIGFFVWTWRKRRVSGA
jgi:hypothetical protein